MKKRAPKKKKREPKVTEWNFGQPLDFPRKEHPLNVGQHALNLVQAAIVKPLVKKKRPRKQRRKK